MIYISDTIKMTLQRKELCLCILCLVCRIYITELVHFFLFTTLYFLLMSHVTSHFFQEVSGDLKQILSHRFTKPETCLSGKSTLSSTCKFPAPGLIQVMKQQLKVEAPLADTNL